MATGIQSSMDLPGAPQTPMAPNTNPMAAAQAEAQRLMDTAPKVDGKVYHSFPGSSYFAPNGERFEFDYKGELEVTNAEVIRQLDMIADKPGSPVFLKNQRPTPAPGDEKPVREIQERAAQTIAALNAARK